MTTQISTFEQGEVVSGQEIWQGRVYELRDAQRVAMEALGQQLGPDTEEGHVEIDEEQQ